MMQLFEMYHVVTSDFKVCVLKISDMGGYGFTILAYSFPLSSNSVPNPGLLKPIVVSVTPSNM